MSIIMNYTKFTECHATLNNAISFINKAKSNVDYGNRLYSKECVNLNGIVDSIKELNKLFAKFEEDYQEAETKSQELVEGISLTFEDEKRGFSLGLTTTTTQATLNLGQGPLNQNILSDYRKIEKTKQREEKKLKLKKQGLIDTDIDRVLKGDITVDDLMVEIVSDSDRSRYQKLLENQYLKGYQYSYAESQAKLDALIAEKEAMEKRLAEVNLDLMLVRRDTTGKIDLDESLLVKEKKLLEDRLNSINYAPQNLGY